METCALFLICMTILGSFQIHAAPFGSTKLSRVTKIQSNRSNTLSPIKSNRIAHQECMLPQEIVEEIATYKPVVQRIVDAALNGVFKGRTWRTLAKFVDRYGSRIAGSDNLERAIDYMVDLLEKNQLENVHTEPAMVPKWVRGKESCWLITPRLEKLKILGLGGSIRTPPKGVTAQAVVVESFEELATLGKEVSYQALILIYLLQTNGFCRL